MRSRLFHGAHQFAFSRPNALYAYVTGPSNENAHLAQPKRIVSLNKCIEGPSGPASAYAGTNNVPSLSGSTAPASGPWVPFPKATWRPQGFQFFPLQGQLWETAVLIVLKQLT